ncbi:FAD-dependent oxidoreductase [uncultured Cohaesibacter sp.]|uniref:FAD-dependent oxidoreductase n=1 Tax=uncultured Cohaesibacter sp. TaxID=1002546 RepID=UPI0029C7F27F|nr:FAD-dependent oxidoreductase [uncultured Cohaesibacter sp.]
MACESRIVVVGAGPAGLSAAVTLARHDLPVTLIDRAQTIGGAIYRQNQLGDRKLRLTRAHEKRWARLKAGFETCGTMIDFRSQTRFAGADWRGAVFLASDVSGASEITIPAGLIVATGARELARPRIGWTEAGVTTVGALQIGMKSTGFAPEGRIVLAGSGPLLLVAAAQLARLGNPPAAVIEAGRPFSNLVEGLKLPLSYKLEAMELIATLLKHRVPIMTGANLISIEKEQDGSFRLTMETDKGARKSISADHVGLHDGIVTNAGGVGDLSAIPTEKAGDCSHVLGAAASEADGILAACKLMKKLGHHITLPQDIVAQHEKERRAQALIKTLYTPRKVPDIHDLPDQTVLCRCENRTVGDLRQLQDKDGDSVRALRLRGRFGMGPCQGRFCLRWVSDYASGTPEEADLSGERWPTIPISVSAFTDATDQTANI